MKSPLTGAFQFSTTTEVPEAVFYAPNFHLLLCIGRAHGPFGAGTVSGQDNLILFCLALFSVPDKKERSSC